ncbi:MAG: undecaprenyl-diphosphate phosphatase [Phycisphaerales bacterium]|nr:undecaprenyl-diphosphate phosphatase [Phycisphaerales bacterium]
MTPLQAAILGLVEGITEFLPISSTGHLILTSWLLGLDTPEMKSSVDAFNVVIQGGAILAVLGLYWPRVLQMLRGLIGRDGAGLKLAINLIVAFLPAAVLGPLLAETIETYLFRPVPVVAALATGGVWMIAIDVWYKRCHSHAGGNPPGEQPSADSQLASIGTTIESMTVAQAMLIGLFQCVAMWPGTSRSMMTIAGAMMLGLKPKHAAEFSFLLGLPTLAGACVFKAMKNTDDLAQLGAVPILVGVLVATISAALAVKWLVAFLNKHGLTAFGVYRLVLAAVFGGLVFGGVVTLAN